jgi:hypothetical protein
MRRLVWAAVVLTLVAGAAQAVYNASVYEVLSPFPLSWTRDPVEIELLELLRTRETLAGRLAATRRIESASRLGVLTPGTAGEEIRAELAALDRRIEAVRVELAARRGGTGAGR